MAAKRITKSAIDWGKFATRISKDEAANFQAFKSRSDAYVAKVQSLPETLPGMDWDKYKKRAPANANIIDNLQKQYAALKIPYPSADATISTINQQEKTETEDTNKWIEESKVRMSESKVKLDELNKIPPIDHLQNAEMMEYFPGCIADQKVKAEFLDDVDEYPEEEYLQWQGEYDYKKVPK